MLDAIALSTTETLVCRVLQQKFQPGFFTLFSESLAFRFVLGQLPCDIEACCSSVAENIGSIEIPVVILTDAPYNYVIGTFLKFVMLFLYFR